jgi:aminobenzoyl-glutamate transport protein
MTAGAPAQAAPRGFMDKLLDGVERVGNKVPHPVLMFAYLILFIIVISSVLGWLGVSVTEEIAVPVPIEVAPNLYEDLSQPSLFSPDAPIENVEYDIQTTTIAIKPILSVEGIRFMFTSFVPTFQGFGALAITLIALMGAGVAEQGGLMAALIRKLVKVAPAGLLAFLIVFVGALASVASDAGYLILIPLAAVAFLAVGRHPIAGLAAGFAGVAAIFMANLIVTPTDAMLFEITNESLGLIGAPAISITADYFFQVVSALVMTLVAGFITVKIVEPRLGKYDPADAGEGGPEAAEEVDPALDARGLRNAGLALLGVLAVVALVTVPPGAPLRDPDTGNIIGQTPFMASLLFIIMLCFFIPGVAYGKAVGKYKHANDVIAGIVKTFAGLGGLILTLLMISQFIAYFNYSQIPNVIAVTLADVLGSAGIGAIPLLIGFVFVIVVLDLIMPGSLAKWAIFAPIFVPLFVRLGVPAQTLFAAYRVADSPMNTLTPLMVYFPVIVAFAQRYDKKFGVGSLVALMMPYAVVMLVVWTLLLLLWFILGIPVGPGYPVRL